MEITVVHASKQHRSVDKYLLTIIVFSNLGLSSNDSRCTVNDIETAYTDVSKTFSRQFHTVYNSDLHPGLSAMDASRARVFFVMWAAATLAVSVHASGDRKLLQQRASHFLV